MSQPVQITVRPPDRPLPSETAAVLCDAVTSWEVAANEPTGKLSSAGQLLKLAGDLENSGSVVHWSAKASAAEPGGSAASILFEDSYSTFSWPENITVLALIPHWRCERWLAQCLASLVHQSYPLTHIVVIDDGSISPPVEIVERFPNVTLLRSANNVGPYRLIQSVIEQTHYTAYLFQDADDWSSCDRLETLLKTARAHSAELVGSQEIRLVEPGSTLQSVGYPLNVNEALMKAPGHALLHPTSLVTRDLIQRIGGFASGLRFGGDSEFLLRAHWAARVVNSDRYGYFRRKRAGSLTTSARTGLNSPARRTLTAAIKEQAIARKQAFLKQQPLDLKPLQVLPSVMLTHVRGPALR